MITEPAPSWLSAHDTRFEFAMAKQLPVRTWSVPQAPQHDVYATTFWLARAPFGGPGTAIDSGPYDGLITDEVKQKVTAGDLAAKGVAAQAVELPSYRDWLLSRQHFWGEPFRSCTSWMPKVARPAASVRCEPRNCPCRPA